MVELIVNDRTIDLPADTSIKYTKQISDIFDLSVVGCSYTSSFEFAKTPNNTRIMEFAGIAGDSSAVPYKKNKAVLKLDGIDLISNGWFNLKNTDDKYNGSILDGMVNFFRAIENRTLGIDLDLKNFEHTKDLNTVVASFSNEYYKYIIADYGGRTMIAGQLDIDAINIDYLTPCLSVRKLLELVFETFGFNCDYTNLDYINGLYITYPKEIAEDVELELFADLKKEGFKDNRLFSVTLEESLMTGRLGWTGMNILNGRVEPPEMWVYVVPESGTYQLDLTTDASCAYINRGNYVVNLYAKTYIKVNGVRYNYLEGTLDPIEIVSRSKSFFFTLNAGDKVQLDITGRPFYGRYPYYDPFFSFSWTHIELKISKQSLGSTSLANELKDFQIKDFIKEIIWRTGLTPIYNLQNNYIYFKTIQERLDFAQAQNFSKCYSKRVNEIYESGYAQRNVFKLKHDNDLDNDGDGFIFVPNANISELKILAQSRFFAPDNKTNASFGSSEEGSIKFRTNRYKIWDTEVKKTASNSIETSYKSLSNRFYLIRKEDNLGFVRLASEKLMSSTYVGVVPKGTNEDTLFNLAVLKNYTDYEKIFKDFRLHTIELAMTITDFLRADLTKPFYFEQENAYYLCNKITFEKGKKTIGEFVKINRI